MESFLRFSKMRNVLSLLLIGLYPAVSISQDSIPEAEQNQLFLNEIDRVLIESAALNYCTTVDSCLLNVYEYPFDSVPVVSDSIYQQRLSALDFESPMDIGFRDEVSGYLDHYVTKRRGQMSRMLGLSAYYFPLFEEQLDAHNLPLELKYLPVVESALNASAESRMGAKGLWQFMYRTGKAYDLQVTSYTDERMNPQRSTEAACRYLSKLYGMYDDWLLSLAAYNAGPGNVNKAMRRSGKNTYWGIRPYLPRETRGYVPAFIAVVYAMNYASEHNIYPSEAIPNYWQCDSVDIRYNTTLKRISEYTRATEAHLKWLNPQYTKGVIPGEHKPGALRLPIEDVAAVISATDSLKMSKIIDEIEVFEYPLRKGKRSTYTVKSGDVLGAIAQRYGVSLRDLKDWNGIRGNMIKPGQKLVMYGAKAQISSGAKKEDKPRSQTEDDGSYLLHIVRRGDTLWDIAKLYAGVSATDIQRLNPGINTKKLKLGHKLKIQKINS